MLLLTGVLASGTGCARRLSSEPAVGGDGSGHPVVTPTASVDLSTPEAAVRSAAEAMRDGDGERFKACFLARGRDERKLLEATARWVSASGRLAAVALEVYGPEEGERFVSSVPYIPLSVTAGRDQLEELPRAEVKVNGRRATVDLPDAGLRELVREGREWRELWPGKVEAGRGDEEAAMADGFAVVYDRLAREMEVGKYPTVDSALAVLGAFEGEGSENGVSR